MDNSKNMKDVKLNEKGKKTALVLVLAASLLAVTAAVFGLFRSRKSDKADGKKSAKSRKQSVKKVSAITKSRAKKRTSGRSKTETVGSTQQAPAVQQPIAQQPVYVVRPLPEKKYESKAHRFKRHMCAAVASILVISLVGSGTMSYVQPATALAAQASFSGIGMIVEEHTDVPYTILNIVPVSATNGINEIALGTLGYLADGQAPIAQVLEGLKGNSAYKTYNDRTGLLGNVVGNFDNSGSGAFPYIVYKEYYGGVDGDDAGLQALGRTQMFPASAVDAGETLNAVPSDATTGVFRGTATHIGRGTDKTGYDFVVVQDGNNQWANAVGLSLGDVYQSNPLSGGFQVSFVENPDGGYVVEDVLELSEIASYASSSWVYRQKEDGSYELCDGLTIWDLVKSKISGNKKEHEHNLVDKWDTDGHWQECTICEYKTDSEAHNLVDERDAGSHWKECSVCGYKTNSEAHELVDYSDGDSHWQKCSHCGYETEHEANDDEIGSGSTGSGSTNAGDVTDDEEEGGNDGDDDETKTGNDDGEGNGDGEGNDVIEDNDDGDDGDVTTEEEDKEDDDKEDDDKEDEEIDTYEVVSAKNTLVSGRWFKLADEGMESGSESESNSKNESDSESKSSDDAGIDWDSIDWDDEDLQGYVVVTFRAVKPNEDIAGKILYDFDSVSSADGETYDAYDLTEAPEEEASEDGPKISLLSLGLDQALSTSQIDGTFAYVGPGNGEWKLTRTEDESAGVIGNIQVTNVSVYYWFSTGTNGDWLRRYVFSAAAGGENYNPDFRVEVITKRADDVDVDDVMQADMIYLESGYNDVSMISNTWGNSSYIDATTDMDSQVVSVILQRTVEELMPVIVDHDITTKDYDTSGTTINYQYLAKALEVQDLEEFCDAMNQGQGGNLFDNIKMYFTQNNNEYPVKDENQYHYVNRNVYVVSGSPLVGPDFIDEFPSEAGFSDVVALIKAENDMRSEGEEDDRIPGVSKAMAVQYIINFSMGFVGNFSDLKILELQPTAVENNVSDFSVVPRGNGSVLRWESSTFATTPQQVISSKKSFKIESSVKSVVEFNGEWEDINGIYDFVFIGLDGRRLNFEEGESKYNNHDLDGLVYHTGDGPYDANDITKQKRADLEEFMDAGYPILVEDECFVGGSVQDAKVNTDYIGENTVMYDFLKNAASDEYYKEHIYTIKDARLGSMFRTQATITKPRISLRSADDGDIDESTVKYVTRDENGEYHGRIAYEITSNKSDDDGYDDYPRDTGVRLYADWNYDGIFAEEERVAEYTDEYDIIDVEIGGMGPGILPWKLEVADSGNSNRRDSVQGYFKIDTSSAEAGIAETKGELKVLQIVSNTEVAEKNLQTMFHKDADSLLAYYLNSVQDTISSDMQFETVTPNDLSIRLGANENYLGQWDIVVVTLDGGLNLGDAAAAVNRYAVDQGRSLLVCGDASSANRAGLEGSLLGQTDDNTYVQLGKVDNYHRYAGLSSSMYDSAKGTFRADCVNEGSISHYPYEMDSKFSVGDDVNVRASAYLLDFSGNDKEKEDATYVTAWYTFGGSSNTAYGISPKDARNNYYCYSKGNVVYLAQSEYPYKLDSGVGDDECKFFVNALFAAYSAGVHNADVRIVAGFADGSADVQSIAVPFDQVWLNTASDSTRGILDNTVDVYFKYNENNIAIGKTVLVGFYYENPDVSDADRIDIGGGLVKASPFATPVWTVTDNRLTLVQDNVLEPGKTYRIQAPVVTLRDKNDENKADIYIVVETTFTRGGKEYTVISSDAVSLNRAQLFLLE